jgi:aspartyl-tRNA(Asn)/glutamyl-tRNA(Gln) amidotransferase subunit A
MLPELTPLMTLQATLADGTRTVLDVAAECVARANGNTSQNTYLGFDGGAVLRQAEALQPGGPLYGVPVSLKDLFDLEGTRTSAGVRFYEELHPPASADSTIAAALKSAGCVIPGKTHLHPLAYGLTGENPDYGDCLQPRDAGLLTGGSSSGAVASVQEGSALAAIGTDTGGSVRIPAALCGLAGFRASHSLPSYWPELWKGGVHLSPSFDTIGVFTRDYRDLEPVAQGLLKLPPAAVPMGLRVGCVGAEFCFDAAPEVMATYERWKQTLRENGAVVEEFDTSGWKTSTEIYAAIQANEAWAIHRAHFDKLEPRLEARIVQRLKWGQSLTDADMESLRSRHAYFRASVAGLLARFELLLMPSTPVTGLPAGADYTEARNAILRYTSPFSLAGLPVVTLPAESFGTGVQLAAAQMEDSALLRFVSGLKS